MKTLPDLSQFYGTEHYHLFNRMTKLVATDGIMFLAEEVGAFWLLDIVASVQHKKKIIEHNNFLIWRIEVKDSSAIVSAYWDCEEDGSYHESKRCYIQKIEYTDFPEVTFEFYQEGNVLLLKGER